MTITEVITALEKVKREYEIRGAYVNQISPATKGGYYHIGNVAIQVSEITELK